MKKRPRDPAQLAKFIVDVATGEVEDIDPASKKKDPAAVERGRSGGLKGGKAAPEGAGDTWTWTAIDADTKLMVSWLVGGRDAQFALTFMDDLKSRLAGRVQLTSDGHGAYLEAVEEAFGNDVDYAQLVKIYGAPEGGGPERRYSPSECIGAEKRPITGRPHPDHISTSFAERQNLTLRMHSCTSEKPPFNFLPRSTRAERAFAKVLPDQNLVVRVCAAIGSSVSDDDLASQLMQIRLIRRRPQISLHLSMHRF